MHVGVIGPVVGDVITASLVKSAKVVITDSRKRNGLDEGTSEKDVEEVPDDLAWVQQIARVGLAATEEGALLQTGFVLTILVIESEESDVGQLESGQVGDHIICELGLLVREQILRSLYLNICGSWGEVVTVGI